MLHKILIVLTPPFDPHSGGVQMSTLKMGSHFASKGHEVHIFSFTKEGHIDPDFAQVYHAGENKKHYNPVNIAYFQKVVSDLSPDIVINQMPYEREIGTALLACKSKKDFLLLGCLRNTLFSVVKNLDNYRKNVLPKPLQPFFANIIGKKILLEKHKRNHSHDLLFILDTYDYFVLFGPPNKSELEYFVGGYKNEKIAFITNSIPKVLDELPKKDKVILYLSRLDYEQKRADLILPLWKKVMNKLPDWRMEIVGDGPALKHIQVQIETEKLPRIKVFGKQKPDEYYREAPIYIMTSAFEGFPNTLIEAQSFGAVPVIYDNYPMAGWVAHDGEDAFLIPPFEVDEMAEKILFLAKNEPQRNKMGTASLKNARRFTIDKVGKHWLDFFDAHLLKNNPQTLNR